MESRKHSRTISPELEALVFDLVRERLLKAVGAGGMWTLQFRSTSDTDALFGETISEYIARDVADQIAKTAIETPTEAQDRAVVEVDADTQADAGAALPESEIAVAQTVAEQTAAAQTVEVTDDAAVTPEPAEQVGAESSTIDTISEELAVEPTQHREHRLFRTRKAA